LSYFLSGKLFIRKSLTSGPHLSDDARCAGPTRQRTAASWPPRVAPTPGLKVAVGTARRASPQPPRPRRPPPDSLARAAVAPTARLARAAVLTAAVRSRRCLGPSPSRAAHRSPVAVTPRRRLHAGEPPFPAVSRAPAPCHRRLAEQRRCRAASRRSVLPPRPHCASGPSVVSALWHPVKFYYFLIYSIHCKFKNLCRIHLNSENYERNFVGKV
jgi:hypothetical protein